MKDLETKFNKLKESIIAKLQKGAGDAVDSIRGDRRKTAIITVNSRQYGSLSLSLLSDGYWSLLVRHSLGEGGDFKNADYTAYEFSIDSILRVYSLLKHKIRYSDEDKREGLLEELIKDMEASSQLLSNDKK